MLKNLGAGMRELSVVSAPGGGVCLTLTGLQMQCIPIFLEHQAVYWAEDVLAGHALVEVFILQGIVGMIVGSFVGLVEVNVAYKLELADPPATEPAPGAAPQEHQRADG